MSANTTGAKALPSATDASPRSSRGVLGLPVDDRLDALLERGEIVGLGRLLVERVVVVAARAWITPTIMGAVHGLCRLLLSLGLGADDARTSSAPSPSESLSLIHI